MIMRGAQLDPMSAAAVVDYLFRQLGPGLAILVLTSCAFVWLLRGFANKASDRQLESQRLFHGELATLTRAQAASERAMHDQLREIARENAAVWQEAMQALAELRRSVADLGRDVRALDDGRKHGGDRC